MRRGDEPRSGTKTIKLLRARANRQTLFKIGKYPFLYLFLEINLYPGKTVKMGLKFQILTDNWAIFFFFEIRIRFEKNTYRIKSVELVPLVETSARSRYRCTTGRDGYSSDRRPKTGFTDRNRKRSEKKNVPRIGINRKIFRTLFEDAKKPERVFLKFFFGACRTWTTTSSRQLLPGDRLENVIPTSEVSDVRDGAGAQGVLR